ncbi:MAG TPA: acetylglutamate kinase [Thermoanaerobaculia bacterium]|nr:acetylglutamate kinase [Thermoanaerobaculia bacterium]
MTELAVVKLGGSLLDDPQLRALALDAIAQRWNQNPNLVVVHGGGKNIDRALARAGIPKRTVQGLRVTDAQTLEIVTGVLAGNVNKSLIAELAISGVAASGFSGADGGTIQANLHPPIDGTDLGFVGRVFASDPALALTLLAGGFLPVIASLGKSPDGSLLNVNADAAAAAVAVAIGATKLVFLTDIEGVLDTNGTIVPSLDMSGAAALLASPAVSGGMEPKLRACLEALAGGVSNVVIAGPSRHAASLAGGEGGTHLVAA